MNRLAGPNDPYVTTSGNIIQPAHVDNTDMQGSDGRTPLPQLNKFIPVKMRGKNDRPEKDAKDQAIINAVVAYKLMGFEDTDIADFFDIHVDDITMIVSKPAAQRTFEMMFMSIIHHNADNLQGRISSHAHSAIDTMVELMEDKKQHGMVRYKASADILDRSGANAEQFFSAGKDGNRADDELTITMMNEADEKSKVAVTIKRR